MNLENTENWGFETKAILKGQSPDPSTGATIPLFIKLLPIL